MKESFSLENIQNPIDDYQNFKSRNIPIKNYKTHNKNNKNTKDLYKEWKKE